MKFFRERDKKLSTNVMNNVKRDVMLASSTQFDGGGVLPPSSFAALLRAAIQV